MQEDFGIRDMRNPGAWVHLCRALYEQARRYAGRAACPSVVIMDGQSVKTTERGGARGFDAHKRVTDAYATSWSTHSAYWLLTQSNRLTHPIGVRGALLLRGLGALFPRIRTIIADAGHESRKLVRSLKQHQEGNYGCQETTTSVQDHESV
jgi:putative transposase